MNDYYSPYKAVHHEDRIKQLRAVDIIDPVFAQIDLTNTCNLNCNFCSYKYGNYSSDQMLDFYVQDKLDKEITYRFLSEMRERGVKALEWTGGGEPTLHPDWKDIISFAKDLEYEQALVTNGTLLDDEGIDLIRDFEWVRFSIDAAFRETYKKIKGKDMFDKAINNLESLILRKDPRNIVGFSFIVCRDNYDEIVEAAQLAKILGCNNIRFSLAYTPQGERMFKDIWDKVVEEIEEAKQEETRDFKVFAFSNRINEIAQKTRSSACYFHEFVATIGANHSLYPCCLLKYDPKFNFGNLKEKSFEEIWFGKKRREFIERVRRGCDYSCWMTQKNEFIHYLIQDKRNLRHINFI